MSERREYFRVRALARVRLRPLAKAEADLLRHALYARAGEPGRHPDVRGPGSAEPEAHALEPALREIARTLERLEAGTRPEAASDACAGPVEISLSGSGFAGPFDLDLGPDGLAWAELELPGSGLPTIGAVGRAVERLAGEHQMAFQFEDIHADDRERIVQLALRIQSQALRAERSGDRK